VSRIRVQRDGICEVCGNPVTDKRVARHRQCKRTFEQHPALLYDAEDAAVVEAHYWRMNAKGYFIRDVGNTHKGTRRRIHLARVLTNAPGDMMVDHKNGNRGDNRRENLRVVDRLTNTENVQRIQSSSGYRGVHYVKARGKWRAGYHGQRGWAPYLGMFDTPQEAARVAREYRLANVPGATN
jgi:hypothetical protein